MRSLKSLLVKYFALLLFTILVIASIIEWFQYKSYLSHFTEDATQKSQVMANNLQATLLFESKKDFDDLTQNSTEQGILLYNSQNLLFAGKGEIFDINKYPGDTTWDGDYLVIKSKIETGGEFLGTLYIKYSTERMQTLVQSQFVYLLVGYFFAIFIFFIILKVVDSQLTTPIKRLSDFVKSMIKNNDLSVRIPIHGKNIETKELKDSFNSLLDSLEEKNNSLSDLNQNLEVKVNEKTEELQLAIEDLKKYQGQIITQEKLASLGSLAAGIAHEIKNPINLINNSAMIIESFSAENIKSYQKKIESNSLTVEESTSLISDLNDIITASRIISTSGKRADGIIKSMLLLSRSQKATAVEASYSHHLDQALNLSFHAMRAKPESIDVNISKEIDNSPEVICYPQDLERAFVNIFDNAFYAMKDRKSQAGDNFKEQLDVNLKNTKDIITISIVDNGVGIPQESIDKIFEPFYTTKPTGQGTGLGMSMVNDIIISHKGELQIKSKENEYTEILITLPTR